MKIQGQKIKRIKDLEKLETEGKYLVKYGGLFVFDELKEIQRETPETTYIFQSIGKIPGNKLEIYPFDVKKITEVKEYSTLIKGKAYIIKLCGYKQVLEYCGMHEDITGKAGLEFSGFEFIRKIFILPKDLQAWSYIL